MGFEASPTDDHPPMNQTNTQRELVTKLISDKAAIETEMDSIIESLNSEAFGRVGLRKSLIDEEGFPLAGIDLLQVRTYRSRFAILQTDLKDIVARIEKSIHEIHEQARATGSVSGGDRRSLVSFGRVDNIGPGSAAEDGGLLAGDKILRFGRLSCFNAESVKDCYDAIPAVLRDVGPNEFIEVQVSRLGRESEELIMRIYPNDGRIGCLIRPV